nr:MULTISPECIES: Ig domain-containing protein [Clostridium]
MRELKFKHLLSTLVCFISFSIFIPLNTYKADTINTTNIGVTYDAHVQNIGWQTPWAKDGETAGTDGKGLRIEALKLNLVNAPADAKILYQAHVQNIGWQNWYKDGEEAGTDGKGLRVEAIRIKLENMPDYSIEYQAHVQNIGWQNWVQDGEEAGTDGQGLRVEAIRIKISKKVHPDSIKLNKNSENLKVGDTDTLSALFSPDTTTNKSLSWTSSDKSTVVVDDTGKITALNEGTANITAASLDGQKTDSCFVTVTKADSKIQYQAHVENVGWQYPVYDGNEAGTNGQGLRVEALLK